MSFVQNHMKPKYERWEKKINSLGFSINQLAEKIDIEEAKLEKALVAIFEERAEPTSLLFNKMERFFKEEIKRQNYGFCESRFFLI